MRIKETLLHQNINDFLAQEDVVDVMVTKYGKCLDKYFKFYC